MDRPPSKRNRTDSTRNWRLQRTPRFLTSLALAIAIPIVVALGLTHGHAAMAAASSLLAVRIARRRMT